MSQKAVFLFAGQGAQSPGMGRDLVAASPAARSLFERADAILGRSLSGLCFEGTAEELTAAFVLPFYLPVEDSVPRGTVGDLKIHKAVRLAFSVIIRATDP